MTRELPHSEAPTLFDDEAIYQSDTKSDAAKLRWSFSKSGTLMQCPRRFYYQYYGANTHKAKNAQDKEALRQLKMLVGCQERTGQILHFTVAYYLREAQAGRPMNAEKLVAWACSIFQKDLELSQQGFNSAEISTATRAPRFLLEYLREEEPDALYLDAVDNMIAALEMFAEAPQFASIREMGMQAGTHIEKHFRKLSVIPFAVEGQVDLAHRAQSGVITIADWKSGEDFGEGDDSLQLAVYALWAKEHYGCAVESIRLYKAFLGSGDLTSFPLTEATLKSARFKILQDVQCFTRMHEYGCAGVVEAFTPCAQEAVCRRCPFLAACPEGKESLTW